jgi:hypothetical protein
MRMVLWIGGLVIVGAVIFIVAPSVSVQYAGNATLGAVNGSGIKGTATFTPIQGGQATIINVQLQLLRPNQTYALSINDGACTGTLLAALQPVTTDNNGNGTSSTTLSATLRSSWFLVLHRGSSTQDDVLACGEVVISGTIVGNNNGPYPNGTPSIIITPTGETPTEPGQFPNTGGGPPQQP